jgi:hypothetical protein
VLENLAPDFTYRYGSLDVQARSMHRILSSIEIGASATELRRRYPAVFSHPIGATHGSISTERYDYEFEVVVDQENGTVARVSSKLRERQE